MADKKKPTSMAMGRATTGSYRIAQQKARRTQNELANYATKEGRDPATVSQRTARTPEGRQLQSAAQSASSEKAAKARAVTKNRSAAQKKK